MCGHGVVDDLTVGVESSTDVTLRVRFTNVDQISVQLNQVQR